MQLKEKKESALPQFLGPVLGKMLNTVVGRTYSRKRINDEFTHLKVSRQRKWQLRRAKEGRCIKGGAPVIADSICWDELKLAAGKRRIARNSTRHYTRHCLDGIFAAMSTATIQKMTAGWVRSPLKPDGQPRCSHYNSDSVWGTSWNLNQLRALAYPDVYSEFVRCHLDIYRDCGWLSDSIAAEKFASGVGTDFVEVMVSGAYAWGIWNHDVLEAFNAGFKNCPNDQNM